MDHNSTNVQSLAINDIVRQALTQRDRIFWLMSIGDQLTDSFGKHSGAKLLVPNQIFHSNILPNPHSLDIECSDPTRNKVTEPSDECSASLINEILEKTAISHCIACTDEKGCF